MSISHRTNRLKVIGNPSVEQLQNGRYRMTFNMTPLNPRNDWYNANKSRIFADFGTLESAEMSVDGIPPRTGEAYDDMRLVAVEAGNRSRVEGGDYIVQFVYETLGDTFVQVKDDTVDYELNGLRRVTRESVAKAGVDFQKTVGTSFIDHQIDTETAVRCYLASYEIDDTDSYRSVEEVYIQAGTLSKDVRTIGDGVRQTTQQDLVTAPTIAAGNYVISEDIDNFGGLKRFTTSFISKSDGTTLTESDGGEKLAFEYEKLVPFTFPGVANIESIHRNHFTKLIPPVEATVKADIYTYYQTSNNISTSDFTKESSLGLWNPSEFAFKEVSIQPSGIGGKPIPSYYNSQALRGYRTRSAITVTGNTNIVLSPLEYQKEDSRITTESPDLINLEDNNETTTVGGITRPVYTAKSRYVYDYVSRFQQTDKGSGVYSSRRIAAYIFANVEIECKYEEIGGVSAWRLYQGVTSLYNTIGSQGSSDPEIKFHSARAEAQGAANDGVSDTYTKPTLDEALSPVLVATAGTEATPDLATWPADVNFDAESNEELIGGTITPSVVFTGGSMVIRKLFQYIEGRRCREGSNTFLKISGGPPNPKDKKYTLDVNIKKAFTDKDGTDIFQKQIVIATCTAV